MNWSGSHTYLSLLKYSCSKMGSQSWDRQSTRAQNQTHPRCKNKYNNKLTGYYVTSTVHVRNEIESDCLHTYMYGPHLKMCIYLFEFQNQRGMESESADEHDEQNNKIIIIKRTYIMNISFQN